MSTATARGLEIAEWGFELPSGWFLVPLDELDAHEVTLWIDGIVDEATENAEQPGSTTLLREELAEVRSRSLHLRADPTVHLAVSVRPEGVMTVGCLLVGSVIELDDDDDADAFERMLDDAFRHPGRGVRTHQSLKWREDVAAGELVGGWQRFEIFDLGEESAPVEDRTVLGVFPRGSRDILRLEFRTQDMSAFDDMPEETTEFARRARIELRPAEDRA